MYKQKGGDTEKEMERLRQQVVAAEDEKKSHLKSILSVFVIYCHYDIRHTFFKSMIIFVSCVLMSKFTMCFGGVC